VGFSSISAHVVKRRRRLAIVALLAGAATALTAGIVSNNTHATPQANTAPEAAAGVPVTISRLEPQTASPFAEFSGRINAVDYAEIRPQVSGRITDIRFRDGEHVSAGDVLFVIDPRPYQAALHQAKAQLAHDQALLAEAQMDLKRYQTLVNQRSIASQTAQDQVYVVQQDQGTVQLDQANLETAQLNLKYAYVEAPISGRVSRAEITLGNLVGSPNVPPPVLTSIVSDNGVYTDFEVDQQTYLNNVRNYGQSNEEQQKIPVDVVVGGNRDRVYRGHIYSFDNRIDTGSGSIRARARFDNTDGALVPGMFVSVRMGNGVFNDALLVPESAIGNDQSKRFVFIVGDDNKAEYRSVALGAQVDGNRVVLTGLKAGDRVILDHLQRLGPGVAVVPQMERRQTASN
jgi:multidrug efflux system membrane fusion protein